MRQFLLCAGLPVLASVQGKITPHVELVPLFFPLAFVGPARAGQRGGLAGLVFFGRDGKMLSYAALVLVTASSQWWAMRR